MKPDIRVRHTKDRVRKAFFQLLNTKEFSQITVTELCQIAEINRTTFYKHYLDMTDLLEKIENDILEDTKQQWKCLHPKSTVEGMEHIFSTLQTRQYKSVSHLFQADPLFSFKLSEVICQSIVPNFGDTPYTPKEQAIIQRIMVYGYGSVTRNWLLSPQDEKMSARQLAEFLFHLTEKLTNS